MKKGNKIAILVTGISAIIMAGSIYYHNQQSNKVVTTEVPVTKKEKEKLSTKNVNVATEIKDGKIVIAKLENISNKDLYDVLIEINYKGEKLGEFYIDNFTANSKKEIELELSRKINAKFIKDNETVNKPYRMLEKFDFTVGDSKGEIFVSSLKDLKKADYEKLISDSKLESKIKEELLAKVKNISSKNEIEKLLKENKVILELSLSEEVTKFGEDSKVVVKGTEEITEESTTTTTETKPETPQSKQEEPVVQQAPQVQQSQTVRQTPAPQPTVPAQPVQPVSPAVQPVVPTQPLQPVEQPTATVQPAGNGE